MALPILEHEDHDMMRPKWVIKLLAGTKLLFVQTKVIDPQGVLSLMLKYQTSFLLTSISSNSYLSFKHFISDKYDFEGHWAEQQLNCG